MQFSIAIDKLTILALSLGFSILTPDVLGQETGLEKKFRRTMNKGEYEKAIQMVPKILSGGMKHLDAYPEDYALLMNLIGVAYVETQETESSITYYQLAIDRIKTAKSDTCFEYGLYAYNLGSAYSDLGQYETADPYILYALPILARRYGASSYEYTMMYFQYALLYIEMGRYAEAEVMFNAMVYYFEQTSGMQSEDYQYALANLGRIYEGMGRYEEAEELMLEVLKYFRGTGVGAAADISVGLNNLAHLYWKTGRMAEAEQNFMEALNVIQRANLAQPLDSATLMNNLALVYKAASRFPEAEAAYNSSIAIYERLKMIEHPDYTNPINNLGELYRVMGRMEEAIDAFVKVIELREKLYGTNHTNYANAVNNLGLVYSGLGYYAQAEQLLLTSKSIYKDQLGVEHQYYANVLNNLGMVYKASGMLDEAEKQYLECLEVTRSALGTSHPKYGLYLNGAGLFYGIRGDYDKAIGMVEKAISITKSVYGDQNYDYIDMVYNVAELYRESGQRNLSKVRYLEAMEGYIHLIHQYVPHLNEEDKTAFYYTVNYRFDTYNSFVLEGLLNNDEVADHELIDKMFKVQLEIKSMLLNEVASIRERVSASGDKGLGDLFQKWQNTKETLLTAYSLPEDDLVLKDIDIGALERNASLYERQLNQGLTQYRMNTPGDDISWRDLAERLHDDEALVEIIRVDHYNKVWTDSVYYVALVIHKDSKAPEVVVIEDGASLETTHYNHYRKSIWNQIADNRSYELFWAPIKNKLDGVRKVLLTPDGCYHKLNLYTLKNPETDEYLIDETSILLQTNSKDLLTRGQVEQSLPSEIQIFAYPNYYFAETAENKTEETSVRSLERYGYSHLPDLPGTKVEAEKISVSFKNNGWTVQMHLGSEATENKLKKVSNPGILHIATHGYFLDRPVDYAEILEHRALRWADKNPLFRSGLMLAGAGVAFGHAADGPPQDGIFSAYEAMQMNLTGTELVVLSACETGLGELHNGQGVYGLQRAFMAAGTKALVMSLWQVEDNATQELMATFYRLWLSGSGISKHEAFRKSQQHVMKKYSNPVFWGAFVMLGQ